MKLNKKTKKLEFTKETIARLEDQQLSGFQGGTGGPDTHQSNLPIACTLTMHTKVKATCNIFICKTKV